MPEKRFFVRIRGKVMGPFGLPQLRSLRDRGQFRAFYEISEDRQAWSSATSLGELFPPDAAGRTYPEELPRAVTAEPSASHSPRDEGWRYVDAEGQEQGPVPRATLLSLHQSGAVQDTTLVWRAGMSEWQPLASAGILPATPRKPTQKKPVAGIVVALVLAGINLLWSCVTLAVGPTAREAVLDNAFPGLENIGLMCIGAWITGSAALLIGAILAQLDHPAGTTTVRVTSWAMIAYVLFATVRTLTCCQSAPAWNQLKEVEQLNFTSGLIGAAIGGVLQFGLILLLLRPRR
jgi:hypothetical protein